jgi:hypothetical protein
LAAQGAREPHYRQLHLSMALSRLSLARHDEALDMLASTDTAAEASPNRGQREHNARGGRERCVARPTADMVAADMVAADKAAPFGSKGNTDI